MGQGQRSAVYRRGGAVLLGVLGSTLLAYNAAAWRSDDVGHLRSPRRYWEDLGTAMSSYFASQTGEGDRQVIGLQSQARAKRLKQYRRHVIRAVAAQDIRAWEFWRSIRVDRFAKDPALVGRQTDDPGRSMILSWVFRRLGGVYPYLPLWLGILAAMPLLVWTAWELFEAGHPLAGALAPLLLACSPFFVDVLSLPYSAVGFYVLGLVLLTPLGTYAVLRARPQPGPLLLRTLVSGLCFAVCLLCRSGAILLLPGFCLVLAFSGWRGIRGGWRRRLACGAGLIALFLLPSLASMRSQRHEAWLGVWEGLGDFDRTKGHYWSDSRAKRALREAGFHAPPRRPIGEYAHETEAFFRERVLRDVAGDPAWYLRILARRVFATVTLERLWPHGRGGDGRTPRRILSSLTPGRSPNEGASNNYWKLATPVDYLGLGAWRRETPVALLCAPTVLLLILCGLGRRIPSLAVVRIRVGPALGVLGCVAVSALVSPVLITTASALETEAFGLVYILGSAFLMQGVALGVGLPAQGDGPAAPERTAREVAQE